MKSISGDVLETGLSGNREIRKGNPELESGFFRIKIPDEIDSRETFSWIQTGLPDNSYATEIGLLRIPLLTILFSREVEDKKDYRFNEDQTRVWYKNYKSYIYDAEKSCDVCAYDAVVSIPNLPGLGAYQELTNPRYNISEFVQQVFSLAVMLMGEYSFV